MSVTRFDDERTTPEANLTGVVDERRRKILAALRGEEGPVDRRSLAEQVAAAEQKVAAADVSDEAVEDVLLSLHHVDLPKLEDAGYLEYDVRENLITPASEDLEAVLTVF